MVINALVDRCPDCQVAAGQPHEDNCDVERCSVCGDQRHGCNCEGHDKQFARWVGIWPGDAEAAHLGIDLNELYESGLAAVLFIKPTPADAGEWFYSISVWGPKVTYVQAKHGPFFQHDLIDLITGDVVTAKILNDDNIVRVRGALRSYDGANNDRK